MVFLVGRAVTQAGPLSQAQAANAPRGLFGMERLAPHTIDVWPGSSVQGFLRSQ
jgi:hypothetical protein